MFVTWFGGGQFLGGGASASCHDPQEDLLAGRRYDAVDS